MDPVYPTLQKLPFALIDKCSPYAREKQSVVAELGGALVRNGNFFPYFLLVALEAGSLLRAVVLTIFSPLSWILHHFVSEAAGIQILIFFSLAGLKLGNIEAVARGVLPKFYAADVDAVAYRVFSACKKRYVVTIMPRIMVEPFTTNHLGADKIFGTEIQITKGGRATGFVRDPGMLVGVRKRSALERAFGSNVPDVAIGNTSDISFVSLCKEGYIVKNSKEVKASVPNEKLFRPVIFHDGRLVHRPTPLIALLIFLWLPISFVLSVIRVLSCILIPIKYAPAVCKILGMRVIIKGNPPHLDKTGQSVLFVCSHRTLLDPVVLSIAMSRKITAVAYSASPYAEMISPIKTVRLFRDKQKDALIIKRLLDQGDLAICPEGTTCREPFLLRFSALFAELTDRIFPVGFCTNFKVFHGNTVRGWKFMDPFFCLMNPFPEYEITFLEQLPKEMTSASGTTSIQVANHVQEAIAQALGFLCTSFTRKDKYRILAGTDGFVSS